MSIGEIEVLFQDPRENPGLSKNIMHTIFELNRDRLVHTLHQESRSRWLVRALKRSSALAPLER